VIGRSLRIEEIPPEQARNELFSFWPAPVVDMLLEAWAARNWQACLRHIEGCRYHGSARADFLEWAIKHAAEFQA
jgi:hypothetical protein